MAKLTGQTLVDLLCARLGYSATPTAAQRAVSLRLLQEADDWISTLAGHKYLTNPIRTPLVDDNVSTLAIPETYETTIVLRRAEQMGKTEVRSLVSDREIKDLESAVEDLMRRPQIALTTVAAGRLSGTELVTRLCERLMWPTGPTPGPTRARALRLLQDADDWISSIAAHKYLVNPARTPLADTNIATLSIPEPYDVSIVLRKAEHLGKTESGVAIAEQDNKDLDLVVGEFLSRPQLGVTTVTSGKLAGTELVTRLCERLRWPTGPTPGPTRTRALRLLREADDWFSSLASHKYLERSDDLVLNSGAETVAVPSWVDIGKTMTLTVGGKPVTIIPADRFRRDTQDAYGAWGLATPTECMIEGSTAAGTLLVRFVRVNGTGGSLTYRLTAQQIRTPLTDSGASFLMIPETYETSIILKRAELQGTEGAVPQNESADLDRVVAAFMDQYRSTRERSMPDSEQLARKKSELLREGQ